MKPALTTAIVVEHAGFKVYTWTIYDDCKRVIKQGKAPSVFDAQVHAAQAFLKVAAKNLEIFLTPAP